MSGTGRRCRDLEEEREEFERSAFDGVVSLEY